MGSFDNNGNSYTNEDVIAAVKKITGKEVSENTEIIQSQKGNEVDISDLWINDTIVQFSIDCTSYEVEKGTTWNEYLIQNYDPEATANNDYWLYYKPTNAIMKYRYDFGATLYAIWLVDESNQQIYRNDLIKSRKLQIW